MEVKVKQVESMEEIKNSYNNGGENVNTREPLRRIKHN